MKAEQLSLVRFYRDDYLTQLYRDCNNYSGFCFCLFTFYRGKSPLTKTPLGEDILVGYVL